MVYVFFNPFNQSVLDMDDFVRLVRYSTFMSDDTIVSPSFLCSSFRIFITSTDVLLSRAPVGSSARMICGLDIKARAMATRCFVRRTIHWAYDAPIL